MDGDSRSIISVSDGWLANTTASPSGIISAMVEETLALSHQERPAIQSPGRRLGDHEFCEADYRQLLLWAQAMAMEPEQVIHRLLDTKSLAYPSCHVLEPTTFQDGRINKLNWDLDLLPLSECEWVRDLDVEYLRFAWRGSESEEAKPSLEVLSPPLPKLLRLDCSSLFELRELNLAGVPGLEELYCSGCGLTNLDLTAVPGLKRLDCHYNPLGCIDLLPVQLQLRQLDCSHTELSELSLWQIMELEILKCSCNNLTELDLFYVPQLRILNCSHNRLVKLDLFDVPHLVELICWSNRLTELNLKAVPHLRVLRCGGHPLWEAIFSSDSESRINRLSSNRIARLDLSQVTDLKFLDCSGNRLVELELAHVPSLEVLDCAGNDLTRLDLAPVSGLKTLDCRNNKIELLDIRSLFNLTKLQIDRGKTRLIQRPDQDFQQ